MYVKLYFMYVKNIAQTSQVTGFQKKKKKKRVKLVSIHVILYVIKTLVFWYVIKIVHKIVITSHFGHEI